MSDITLRKHDDYLYVIQLVRRGKQRRPVVIDRVRIPPRLLTQKKSWRKGKTSAARIRNFKIHAFDRVMMKHGGTLSA